MSYCYKNFKFILVLFTGIIFLIIINSIKVNYNIFKYTEDKNISVINNIIIVGDSRMELIEGDRKNLRIPSSIIIDAKSGAKIKWLKNEGIPKLLEIIKDRNKNYKYHVVFNMGVNDIDDDIDIEKRAKEYFIIYESLSMQYKDISFYLLSVNPVDESRIYKSISKYTKRTNSRIKELNSHFIDYINKEKISNLKYCNSYDRLEFELPDGLHYDFDTNKRIINYIMNNCIK